jgi:hypothetical protein
MAPGSKAIGAPRVVAQVPQAARRVFRIWSSTCRRRRRPGFSSGSRPLRAPRSPDRSRI